jgi:cold shock CspA family protein
VEKGMKASRCALAYGLLLVAGGLASAQETTRVSVDSSGVEGNGQSNFVTLALSTDGSIVAFYGDATNLVANDTNGVNDVFVHDRSTGLTERISVDSSGVEGNKSSDSPSPSADGLEIAFESDATNLVARDTNGVRDVFVRSRTNGITERVSVDSSGIEGNLDSYVSAISVDARIVAFYSNASNLVTGDTNGAADVFVHDRVTGTTERVSVNSSGVEGNAYSAVAAVSADGRFVAFYSAASNLVPGDTNGTEDAFVHDRLTGGTERISVDSLGNESNAFSGIGAISENGQFVAFWSIASNLVANDTNANWDVFVHDRSTGVTERVSVDSSGIEGDGLSQATAISSDGQLVAFGSDATNLVTGDTNGDYDMFVHDRTTGITDRVSVDSLGTEANDNSSGPAMSSDGRVVAFPSSASNLVSGDTNGTWDVFVHERCITDATWANYGAGFSGTNGVPTFTAESDPVLGSSLTVDLGDSSGGLSIGLLFIGFAQTVIHSALGGDLLVVPAITSVVGLAPSGMLLTGAIPNDGALCGFEIDLQAIESDPGATKGVSFTPGLELTLGH